MKRAVIIVAGGSGTRMQSATPKQFLLVCGRPILMHTIEKFAQTGEVRIVVVLPAEHIGYWQELCKKYDFKREHSVVAGGKTRFESVRNGLMTIDEKKCLVGVHDGVRPLVSAETIGRCYDEAQKYGTAVPAMKSTESVRLTDGEKNRAIDRNTVMMIQTPQVFKYEILRKAYEQPYTELFTDDASVVERAGYAIHLCEGNTTNIKITTPSDLRIAECFMGN